MPYCANAFGNSWRQLTSIRKGWSCQASVVSLGRPQCQASWKKSRQWRAREKIMGEKRVDLTASQHPRNLPHQRRRLPYVEKFSLVVSFCNTVTFGWASRWLLPIPFHGISWCTSAELYLLHSVPGSGHDGLVTAACCSRMSQICSWPCREHASRFPHPLFLLNCDGANLNAPNRIDSSLHSVKF